MSYLIKLFERNKAKIKAGKLYQLQNYRKKAPAKMEFDVGDRIAMVDMQNDPKGAKGTVVDINWMNGEKTRAQICVDWDNGRGLKVLWPEDIIEKIAD